MRQSAARRFDATPHRLLRAVFLAVASLVLVELVTASLGAGSLGAGEHGSRNKTHEHRPTLPMPADPDRPGARIVALGNHLATTPRCSFCLVDLTLAHLDLTDSLAVASEHALTTTVGPLRQQPTLTDELGIALLGEARKARIDGDSDRARRHLRAAETTFAAVRAEAPGEPLHGLRLALVRLEQVLADQDHHAEAVALLQAFLTRNPDPTIAQWVGELLRTPETLLAEERSALTKTQGVHVSGNIDVPEPVLETPARYSAEGLRRGIEGVVILQTVIDRHGVVQPIRVLKDLPAGLGDEALRAVSSWQYAPARRNGEAVAIYHNVVVRFRLD